MPPKPVEYVFDDRRSYPNSAVPPAEKLYAGLSLANDTFLDGLTATIDNTETPNWNHSFGNYLESELVAQGLIVNIRDSDGLGVYETIGNCIITITAQDIAAGFVVKPTCGYASNVRITFTSP
ncbi:MAG: C2 domain-containing protein [Kofleriaceae bacterium]